MDVFNEVVNWLIHYFVQADYFFVLEGICTRVRFETHGASEALLQTLVGLVFLDHFKWISTAIDPLLDTVGMLARQVGH